MARQAKRSLRRVPVGRSATEIVDAVVAAATELVIEGGLAKLTTNHVAERAGVSVGSVYRYFPDKVAIVVEIDRRHRRARADQFLEALERPGTLEEVIRRGLATFVAVDAPATARLRAVLAAEIPPAWVASTAAVIWSTVLERSAVALMRHLPTLSPADAARRTFVALHAAQGAVAGSTLWGSGYELSLLDELVHLIVGYLRRPLA